GWGCTGSARQGTWRSRWRARAGRRCTCARGTGSGTGRWRQGLGRRGLGAIRMRRRGSGMRRSSSRRRGGRVPPRASARAAGELVPPALSVLDKGGVLVLGGIYMSPVPALEYGLLYQERVVRSVTNNTREDGREFLAEAARVGVRTEVRTFVLEETEVGLIA